MLQKEKGKRKGTGSSKNRMCKGLAKRCEQKMGIRPFCPTWRVRKGSGST
jgi:hypothetical protein